MEYKLYNGKNLVSINGNEGLKATLDLLQNKKEVRLGLIHHQKVFTTIGGAMDEMLKKEYLFREGTKEECEREDNDTFAVMNFARVLKENFPEDWKATVVTMYSYGTLPLSQDLKCPECHRKLQERKRVNGYICRNDKCKNFYQVTTPYDISRGVIFKPEKELSTIVLEPKL